MHVPGRKRSLDDAVARLAGQKRPAAIGPLTMLSREKAKQAKSEAPKIDPEDLTFLASRFSEIFSQSEPSSSQESASAAAAETTSPSPQQVPDAGPGGPSGYFPAKEFLDLMFDPFSLLFPGHSPLGPSPPERPHAIRVAFPCGGIVETTQVFDVAGLKIESVNIMDTDIHNRTIIKKMARKHALSTAPLLGKANGNMLSKPVTAFEGAEVVVGKPPLPAWAVGAKRSESPTAMHEYAKLFQYLMHLINSDALQVAVVARPSETMESHRGREPFLPNMLSLCAKHAPHFHWDIVELRAQDYGLPQPDVVQFIRCLRKVHSDVMPDAMATIGSFRLSYFLDQAEENIIRGNISWKHMRENLAVNERFIKRAVRRSPSKRTEDSVAAVNIDRPGSLLYCDDALALSLDYKHVFLLSTRDLEKPCQKRMVFRFLSDKERVALKGVNPHIVNHLSPDHVCSAAARYIPTTLLGAAAMPLIKAMISSGKRNYHSLEGSSLGQQSAETSAFTTELMGALGNMFNACAAKSHISATKRTASASAK
ncbi:unnamed protein product [Prorocentrum cordatum]|uniref:Uncharacterized protein n=1 Tax=Prorocentrum cordatum TaxID=2364126 RepID=A0ABN9Y419_9DINO|nr:unnamed protein product [Polarella glacialis]